ncbi:MAG: metallophosphoesterase [Desulfosarcina sp.]|nr:metallophosphoesterase [Desulfosarcina sp.]
MKILHTADFHIKDSSIDEGIKCLDFLVDWARKESPDLIIIAGDLTHRNDVKWDSKTARVIILTVAELADIAPVFIVKGTPYHDGDIPEMLDRIRSKHSIVVSLYPEQCILSPKSSGGLNILPVDSSKNVTVSAIISMVPCPTKAFLESQTSFEMRECDNMIENGMGQILAAFGRTAAAIPAPHILIGHWTVGGAFISEKQQMIGRDIEISQGQIQLADANLVCLGHIHKAQKIGQNIFYPGSLYSLTAGELDPKGFYIHELGDHGLLQSEFIKAPATRRLILDADFTNGDRLADLESILHTFSTGDIHGSIIHARFRIWEDETAKLDVEQIKQNFEGAVEVVVDVVRVPRANVRSKNYFRLNTLREKIEEQAKIKDEVLPAGIPDKVESLESMEPDKIFEGLPVA